MKEVDATKCTSDQRKNSFAAKLNLGTGTDMGKDIMEAELAESQLNVLCVSTKV